MDLSKCYLHTLGPAEGEKLGELRARVPEVVARAREGSAEAAALPPGGLTIWRVRIEEKSDASDIVLLKYLRAEELDVAKAAERMVQTLIFRADCKIDVLAEVELPEVYQGHDFLTGVDTEGRPIVVSRFGNMDIDRVFGDLEAFVRYRSKIMENAISMLKFEKGAAEDLCQVHDYSGVISSMYKSDVKNGVTAISRIFSEHYPEFKGKTIFVNFPAVFCKPFQALASLLPERTRKKFVVLGQDDHVALFEHLAPELVPYYLGGLVRDPPGPLTGPAQVVIIRARDTTEVQALKVPAPGKLAWELRVCTLEVAYEVLFTRDHHAAEDGKASEQVIASSKPGQPLTSEEGVLSGEWLAPEAGVVRIRFRNENAWFKRRVAVCRAGMLP